MKKFLLILATLSFGPSAFANQWQYCENGDISNVGDGHYAINLFEDGIEFLPYEGSFDIDFVDVLNIDRIFEIRDVKTELTVEGESSEILVDALLELSLDEKKLNVEVSINKGPTVTYEMSCVTKSQDENETFKGSSKN